MGIRILTERDKEELRAQMLEYHGYATTTKVFEITAVEGGYYNTKNEWINEPSIFSQNTSLIPVTPGEKFIYTGKGLWEVASVLWYNKDKVLVSADVCGSESGAILTVSLTVPAGASYARFQSFNYAAADVVLKVEFVKGSTPTEGSTIEIIAAEGGYFHTNGNWVEEPSVFVQYTEKLLTEPGEKFIYTGKGLWTVASAIWYNGDGAFISSELYGSEDGAIVTATVTTPEGAAFVMFQSFNYAAADVVLGVTRVSEADQSTGDGNLAGKTIVYDGDSICESRIHGANSAYPSLDNGGGYAKIIADLTLGAYVNHAKGGARLRTLESGGSYHSIVDNLENLPTDGDLYCFEGGVNDYWGSTEIGEVNMADYEGSLDETTICGALETIFRYALNTFVGKPICFVITHKIQSTAYVQNNIGKTFEEYHDAMVRVCQKYSIPYYDAFNESGLNGWNTAQSNMFLTSNTTGVVDGCHPTAEAYKRYYVPQLIALFERIMPRGV